MTRRSALLAGIAALAVLLSGQVVVGWFDRPAAQAAALRNRERPKKPAAPPAGGTATRPPQPQQPVTRPPRGTDPRTARLVRLGVKRVTAGGGVALTFDDGPHAVYTPVVLALLRKHKLRATFCVVGTEVRRYPQLVAQMVREGHALCNHSWHHELDLGSRPAAEIRANLLRTNAEIRRAVPGARIPFYRQPGGEWTKAVVKASKELGMVPLDWTVDPSDWKDVSAAQVRGRVLGQTRKGSVVLMHDGGGDRAATAKACRTILPKLKSRFRVGLVR